MEPFLVSTALVALAEMGDKTQLLSLLLAARFRCPWALVAGIFAATLANHALAGLAGVLFGSLLDGAWLHWVLGLSFLAFAVWVAFPDRYDAAERPGGERFGAFLTALGAFFVAEIGDKTQIATIGLAARFHQLELVVLGTTAGMMLANVPAVLIGERLTRRLPLRAIRMVAASIFAVLGAATLYPLL
jgi:putative Ca2+/H+ antiporter (TMEM165/GDT1 family)